MDKSFRYFQTVFYKGRDDPAHGEIRIIDLQTVDILHSVSVFVKLMLQYLYSFVGIGDGEADVPAAFCFQFSEALLLQQDTFVYNADIIGEQGDLGQDMAGDQDGFSSLVA